MREKLTMLGVVAAAAFVATVWLANWLLQRYGIVFIAGVAVPAGVFAAGAALTLRDIVNEELGRVAVLVCIAAGCALALIVAPRYAVASAAAFGLSELADLSVWESLPERVGFLAAVLLSNVVGALVDTLVFLSIAFGNLDFFKGQYLGKMIATALSLPVAYAYRVWRQPRRDGPPPPVVLSPGLSASRRRDS